MIKFWINLTVIAVIVCFGLAIGAANDGLVPFDFLVVKAEVTLASVLVVGVCFGFALGALGSILFFLKLWNEHRKTRSELNKVRKQLRAYEDERKKEQKEDNLPVKA